MVDIGVDLSTTPEIRTCKECGSPYTIQNYERSHPRIRDLCLPCLEKAIQKFWEDQRV
jgi:hypothetical protein